MNFVGPHDKVTLSASDTVVEYISGDTFATLIVGLLRTCCRFPYVIAIAHSFMNPHEPHTPTVPQIPSYKQ